MRVFIHVTIVGMLVAFAICGTAGSASASESAPASVDDTMATQVASAWVVACSSEFPSWVGATVGSPVPYYSHDDIKSVYEFTVLNGGTGVGYIMVAARKYWGPILEFGTGEAPSRNLVQARKQAAAQGYVSIAEPLSPCQYHAAGSTSAPVYYYDGAGTAAVQVGDKMKKDNKVIGLQDGGVRSKTEVADLQIDAATAQTGWESLLGRTPLFAASLDIAYEHDSWSVMTIPELNPVATDVEDVVGMPGVVPCYRQGPYNNRHVDTNGDGIVDDRDDECPGCRWCYGDDACDPTAVYPYYVGSAPDPWGYGTDDGHPCAWDGCTTIAGAMVLGYWMNRGYENFNCGIDDEDTEDALIDLCHLKMETDDLGYTHDIEWVGPGPGDFWPVFMHRVTTGLHNVAALYTEPFYFGYDFEAEDHFPIAVTDIKSEIDAGRPMLLHYQADNHSVAVIGYAEVLSEEAAEQNPLYPFDL